MKHKPTIDRLVQEINLYLKDDLDMQIKKQAYAKLMQGLVVILDGFEEGILQENGTAEDDEPDHNEGRD